MAQGLAHYRVIQGLYRGGQADVFLAVDQRSQRQVCIKIYHLQGGAAARRRVQAEAWKLARVDSPRVVDILDVVGYADELALVTRYVPGVDMQTLLQDQGRLTVEDTLSIAMDLALALGAVHRQQLVHGDLSARNVFLDGEGRATLGDFGIAVQQGEALAGFSPQALAPEQARGEKSDPRSDFFCLGLLLYRALYGQPLSAVEGSVDYSALQRGLDEAPPLPGLMPGVADDLAQLFRDLLAQDPDQRLQTAVKLRERLRQLRVRLPASTELGGHVVRLQRSLPAPELPLRLPRHLVTLPPMKRIRDWMRGYWVRGSTGARLLVAAVALGLPMLLHAWLERPGPCVAVADVDFRAERMRGVDLPAEAELLGQLVRLAKRENPQAMVIADTPDSDSLWTLSRHGLSDRCVAQRLLTMRFECQDQHCDLVLDARGPGGVQQLSMPYVVGIGEQRFLSELRRHVAEQMAFLVD